MSSLLRILLLDVLPALAGSIFNAIFKRKEHAEEKAKKAEEKKAKKAEKEQKKAEKKADKETKH